jgi:hypothetical protein
MNKLFKRLCLICFWIVLAAVPLGIFEILYFHDPKATLLGCQFGEYAINCDDRPLQHFKEIILNLPFGFMLAPAIVIRPWVLNPLPPPSHPLLIYMQPLMIYLSTLTLMLALAIIHIFRKVIWLATGLWKHR